MYQVNIATMGIDAGIVSQDPGIKSGAPVFPGTRVPVRFLHYYLEDGLSLDKFLDDFPTVTKEQVVKVLELAFEKTIGPRDDEDFV